MERLIADMQRKVVFEPALKEWFKEFDKPLLSINTVIVSDKYELPFEVKENELHLVVNKTFNSEGEHGDLWEEFNHSVIKAVSKMNMVFVFVGLESYRFVKYIGESKKFLMPNATDKFWGINSLVEDYNTKKENVLKRALLSK
jgi:hypothetical protein